jgi:hypothetical protein
MASIACAIVAVMRSPASMISKGLRGAVTMAGHAVDLLAVEDGVGTVDEARVLALLVELVTGASGLDFQNSTRCQCSPFLTCQSLSRACLNVQNLGSVQPCFIEAMRSPRTLPTL